jgi:hypothetical protein
MYSSYKPYGHINKTNGPTFKLSRPTCKLTHGPNYKHNGHICNPIDLSINLMDILANLWIYLQTYGSICKTYGTTYRPYGHIWTHNNQTSYPMNMGRP